MELVMKYSEFAEMIKCGVELGFFYNGYEYDISNNSDGYYFTQSYREKYETAAELFSKAKIDGKYIYELWSHINDQLKDYKNYDELESKVSKGEQPYFDYGEYLYSIENNNLQRQLLKTEYYRSKVNDPIPDTVFYLRKGITQEFKTPDELLKDARIEGKTLSELYHYLCDQF